MICCNLGINVVLMVRSVLEKIYEWGLGLDKSLTNSTRLPAFVVSVGNIAVGGRAKTPLVVDLVRFFQREGFEPVVLTRGYGRQSSLALEIDSSTSVESAGDEPVEIFIKTGAKVLVGAKRAENALLYLKKNSSPKNIFILDDGFQHWALKRDLDLVLINNDDLSDSLLPLGRLRERPQALKRADLVLNLDENCFKRVTLNLNNHHLSKEKTFAITTRAGSQENYLREISRLVGFSFHTKQLKDHLSGEALKKELLGLPQLVDTLILGMKEAVKLFSIQELMAKKDLLSLNLSGRVFQVCIANLELEWNLLEFKKIFEEKMRTIKARL
jgi:tetraacyldisaccharide-1-P 4'-kinase